MNAVLKYHGAKNRLASKIIENLPPHRVYVEPFAGSLAVFLNKEPSKREVVNDLDNRIVNFFKVLREYPSRLTNMIRFTPYSRNEQKDCNNFTKDNSIENARKFAVMCWQSFGSNIKYKSGWKHSIKSSGSNPAGAWKRLPKTLREASSRLKDAQIECKDAIELIKEYNYQDTLIYADPPYPRELRKADLYKYDKIDHQALLNVLIAHKGPVVISSYDNPLYNEMLKDWKKVEIKTTAEHGLPRVEVLWIKDQQKEKVINFELDSNHNYVDEEVSAMISAEFLEKQKKLAARAEGGCIQRDCCTCEYYGSECGGIEHYED